MSISVVMSRSSKPYYPHQIPPSPFNPNFTIKWDFDSRQLLSRHDVIGKPPKVITFVVKAGYIMPLPEPVRLRFCPEMPCRLTTNVSFQHQSAALIFTGKFLRNLGPPLRSHPEQVI